MCAFVILLPVLSLAVFWLLPTPIAVAAYAAVLVITVWVLRSIGKSVGHLWNRSGNNQKY